MSEAQIKTSFEKPAASPTEAAANLHYFWEREGNPDLDKISAHDKRIMFDVPLMVYLDKLLPNAVYSDERNTAVKGFEGKDWWPKSAAEIRMATAKDEVFLTEGPAERLRRATHSGTGEASRAQKATFETIHSYMQDAENDKAALIRALTISERGSFADVAKIRADTEILNIIADYLHGREILAKGFDYNRNYKKFGERQRYWRGFMQAAAQPDSASDEVLSAAFIDIWGKIKNRLEYWQGQQHEAYKKVGHVLIDDVQAVAGPARAEENNAIDAGEPEHPEDNSRDTEIDWKNYRPPTPFGQTFEIEGLGNIPVVQKDEEESRQEPREETEQPIMPRQLFNTKSLEKSKKNKRGRRPRRPIKPSERRKPGYDHERDPSNPQPF